MILALIANGFDIVTVANLCLSGSYLYTTNTSNRSSYFIYMAKSEIIIAIVLTLCRIIFWHV